MEPTVVHRLADAAGQAAAFDALVGPWIDEMYRVAALPADQRIAVVLHHVADLSVPQIAVALSVPEGTVKSRIRAGIERLRAAMESEGDR
jgi:RNA polymerase sigma-70 factor (ECF subfamily)